MFIEFKADRIVLMPCRALEAFRLRAARPHAGGHPEYVLMPCRALEAFRHTDRPVCGHR